MNKKKSHSFVLISKQFGIINDDLVFLQITEVEMVCPWYRDNVPRWALSEHLRYFCGIVAVGTNCGHVFLVGKIVSLLHVLRIVILGLRCIGAPFCFPPFLQRETTLMNSCLLA